MEKLPLTLFLTALLIEFIPKTSVSQKAIYQRQPEAHGGFGKKLKKSKKLLTESVVTVFDAVSKGSKLLRRNKVMVGTKFHLVAMKSHWNIPQIILKFAQSNTLLWRMTELWEINVRVCSGYLCDITLLEGQEFNQRRLLRQEPKEAHTHHTHAQKAAKR